MNHAKTRTILLKFLQMKNLWMNSKIQTLNSKISHIQYISYYFDEKNWKKQTKIYSIKM